MANAIRTMTVDRGIDPRDFALFSFGGAGSLHSSLIARELGIPSVVVPPSPGNFAAWGLLCADVKHDYHQTFVAPLADVDADRVEGAYLALEDLSRRVLERDGLSDESVTFVRAMDLRYLGQGHALTVPVPSGRLADRERDMVATRFDDQHLQTYLHHAPEEEKEIVSLKVTGIGAIERPAWPKITGGGSNGAAARVESRPVYVAGKWVDAEIYDRSRLLSGDGFDGPAILEEDASTTLVLPDQSVRVDERGALFLTWKGA
jgi:N-methylhydantoinase A